MTHYLVGSYHFALDIDIVLGPGLKEVIDASDAVVFESFRTGANQEGEAIRRASRPVDQLEPPLPDDLVEELDRIVSPYAPGWKKLPPLDLSVLLARIVGGAGGLPADQLRPSLDQVIRAATKGKPRGRLELPAEQYRVYSEVPTTSDWQQAFRAQLDQLGCRRCPGEAADRTRKLMKQIARADWGGLGDLLREPGVWSDAHIQLKVLEARDPVLASRVLSMMRRDDDRTRLFVIGGSHIKGVTDRLRREAVEVTENCSKR